MKLTTRLKTIEQRVLKKNGQRELIIVTESNGKYYMEKDGRQSEVNKPDYDPNKLVIILKSYQNYEMHKDFKQ